MRLAYAFKVMESLNKYLLELRAYKSAGFSRARAPFDFAQGRSAPHLIRGFLGTRILIDQLTG
jgi:hypothetical protein